MVADLLLLMQPLEVRFARKFGLTHKGGSIKAGDVREVLSSNSLLRYLVDHSVLHQLGSFGFGWSWCDDLLQSELLADPETDIPAAHCWALLCTGRKKTSEAAFVVTVMREAAGMQSLMQSFIGSQTVAAVPAVASMPVASLKERIEEATGLPAAHQRLFRDLDRREMADGDVMSDHGRWQGSFSLVDKFNQPMAISR
jgi:hypothetical protein